MFMWQREISSLSQFLVDNIFRIAQYLSYKLLYVIIPSMNERCLQLYSGQVTTSLLNTKKWLWFLFEVCPNVPSPLIFACSL